MTPAAQQAGTPSTSSAVVTDPSPQSSSSSSTNSGASLQTKSAAGGKKKPNDKDQSKLLLPCLIGNCKIKCQLGHMRRHVGVHIQKGTLSGYNICGFCGRDICSNTLTAGSKNSSKQFLRISTNCKYDSFIQRKPVFSTRHQCSNHLVPCPVCKAAIWTYNAKCHFEALHPDVEYEDSKFVSSEERTAMSALARKLKQ